MSEDIVIRFLENPSDAQIEEIVGLYRAEGWWDPEAVEPEVVRSIVRGSRCFAAALRGDSIVGMGRAISDGVSDAYIQDVAVSRELRGKGVGSRVIRALVDRLLADKINWIGLIAERGSHGFYTRLGFEKMPDSAPLIFKRK